LYRWYAGWTILVIRCCGEERNMESIKTVIEFLSSYPMWAKLVLLGNVVCIAGTLVFASRVSSGPEAVNHGPGQPACSLRIERAELFPDSASAEIQITAFVNGTEFRYPSLAEVDWLKVAPSMAGQTFKLPKAEQYEIRFEMHKRENPGDPVARLVSQETVTLKDSPFTGIYGLHGFDPSSRTRSGQVSAQVIFSFEPAH
jgi:hypothetical protein